MQVRDRQRGTEPAPAVSRQGADVADPTVAIIVECHCSGCIYVTVASDQAVLGVVIAAPRWSGPMPRIRTYWHQSGAPNSIVALA